jgi:soluble lytic murein transglycosylase-like protein
MVKPSRAAVMGGACAAALAASAAATPAHGEVIQIGPGGVTRIAGPAVHTLEGIQPILPSAPAVASAPGGLTAAQRARRAAVQPLLADAGARHELSPQLLEAVAWAESRFDVDAVSPAGARGLMQLMPGTAAELGVDPASAGENARGGAAYLRRMLVMFDGDVELALAAYNAGPEAVLRHDGVPPYAETRGYVAAVMDYLARSALPEAP